MSDSKPARLDEEILVVGRLLDGAVLIRVPAERVEETMRLIGAEGERA